MDDFSPDEYLAVKSTATSQSPGDDFNPDAYLGGSPSPSSYPVQSSTLPQSPGLISKAWDALAVPQRMANQGLSQLASYVPQPEPTGNLPMDIVKGTPRIAANTIAEAAPGFISRGALVAGGLAKGLQVGAPLAGAIGRGVAGQLESLSGAMPGSLSSAWNDATTMLSQGKAAAKPFYEAAKAEVGPGESLFAGMYQPKQIVEAANEYLSKGGKLEPAEALMYRKAIDKLIKSPKYVADELYSMRDNADAMAKASDNIAQADPLYQKGMYGESLRHLMPQNKYGGASAFKAGIMTALANMGTAGRVGLAALSPAAMGTAATVGGLATRAAGAATTNPGLAMAVQQLLNRYYSPSSSQPSPPSQ